MSLEDIIQVVQGRPEIWQLSHPMYHSKELRKRIWRQISKDLKTDEQLLKKRWKHLLDQYRKEFKKMQKQSTYKGEPVPCSWIHYESLAFLKDEMAMRKDRDRSKIGGGSDSENAYNEPMAQESYQQEDNEETSDNYDSIVWKYNATAKQYASQQQTRAAPASTPSTSQVSKADLILRRLQNLSAAVGKTSQVDELRTDEDYMFFMSILPMVRGLSPMKKLQLRGKINEWLLQTMSGEPDPLNSLGQFVGPVETCEDDKEAVMKQIMEADDNQL